MWPVTSVRCDSFSLRRRLASARGSLGWVADVEVTLATVVDAAGVGAAGIGVFRVGATGIGDVSILAVGVGAAEGFGTGVDLETGVVVAGVVWVPSEAAPSITDRGMRTDFRQRLQSIIFTVAITAESTTIGAEQCGQSKRISLLIVPDSDAPVRHR
jgi:hypothetical protein